MYIEGQTVYIVGSWSCGCHSGWQNILPGVVNILFEIWKLKLKLKSENLNKISEKQIRAKTFAGSSRVRIWNKFLKFGDSAKWWMAQWLTKYSAGSSWDCNFVRRLCLNFSLLLVGNGTLEVETLKEVLCIRFWFKILLQISQTDFAPNRMAEHLVESLDFNLWMAQRLTKYLAKHLAESKYSAGSSRDCNFVCRLCPNFSLPLVGNGTLEVETLKEVLCIIFWFKILLQIFQTDFSPNRMAEHLVESLDFNLWMAQWLTKYLKSGDGWQNILPGVFKIVTYAVVPNF